MPDRPTLQVPAEGPAGCPELQLLGSPRLLLADGSTLPLERKDAALMALLAIDGPTARSRLAALLWPEGRADQARTNLRQRLLRLTRAASQPLVLGQGTLRLNPALRLRLDADEESAASPVAYELLGGLDLSDLEAFSDWLRLVRARRHQSRSDRLAARAAEHEAAGDLMAALMSAQQLVALEPMQEETHRRVMRLHYLRGDRAAALAAYIHCRQVLRAQLGVEPSGETAELAATIEARTLPSAAAPRPLGTILPPQLIGRDAELRVLQLASAAVVLGEPGIGKSRLLAELASGPPPVPVTGARPGDAAVPYALLARIAGTLCQAYGLSSADWVRAELAHIAPALGEPGAAASTPLRLRQAFEAALAHWHAAGLRLLAVDDLQFADEASLDALLPLVGVPGPACVLAARSGELSARLQAWLRSAAIGPVRALRLQPLPLAGVEALLRSARVPGLDAAAWAPTMYRHAGGNPLLLLETLAAALRSRVPVAGPAGPPPQLPENPRIDALIGQQLQRLSARALDLVRVAAVAGNEFGAALGARVLGLPLLDIAEAWGELESAGILRGERFAHDLIHEAALRSVPAAIASELHGRVAEALDGRLVEPARLARHWLAARRWIEAGASLLAAAHVAQRQSQHQAQVAFALQAADCFRQAGDAAGEFAARERVFNASRYAEPYDRQYAHAQALMQQARTAPQRLAALEALARTHSDNQQAEAAYAAASEAAVLARACGEPARGLSLVRLQALALSRMNRQGEALAPILFR